MWWYITGMLNNKVETVIESKDIIIRSPFASVNLREELTEIFNKNPNRTPATVVRRELSLNIEP
jgi:hypothetical protein